MLEVNPAAQDCFVSGVWVPYVLLCVRKPVCVCVGGSYLCFCCGGEILREKAVWEREGLF